RRLGFPPRLLSSQPASHQVLESRREIVRSERASGRLRGPKARQRNRLGLDVDQGGDAAEPIEQRRDRHEAIVTPVKMRTKAKPTWRTRGAGRARPGGTTRAGDAVRGRRHVDTSRAYIRPETSSTNTRRVPSTSWKIQDSEINSPVASARNQPLVARH